MPVPEVPEGFITPTRDDVTGDGKKSWLVRHMEVDATKPVDVGPGTFPAIAAEVAADLVMPIYANAVAASKVQLIRGIFGARLDRVAVEKLGEEDGQRKPATGGTGYIEATKIADGGAHIDTTATLVHKLTGVRFAVLNEQDYLDGDPIAIEGIDTGTTTNLAADAILEFESQPPGVSLTARVLSQNDGTGVLVGLTGGRGAETDEELQSRIIEAQSNPPAAGNAAQVAQLAQKTGGVPVEKAFVISAPDGSGTTAVPFTLRPDAALSRIPNSVQRGLVEAQLRGGLPLDWTITVPSILAQPLTIALGVTWLSGATGWADIVTFPEYVSADPIHVSASYSTAYLRASTSGTATAPEPGQTIGLFDIATKTFKRKRIATVTQLVANKSWDLTFTAALGASDSFVAEVGALISPWSPSLNRLPAAIVAYTRTLGPGEQFATFPDPGGRQKRWPESPDEWPSIVTNEGLVNAARASRAISDVETLLPATPHATTVGVPGILNYLQQLTDLAVYPQ